MLMRPVGFLLCLLAVAGSAFAQEPQGAQQRQAPARPAVAAQAQTPRPAPTAPTAVQAPPPEAAATPAPARIAPRKTQPINLKIDLSITDQRAGSAAVKRTLSVVAADGTNGFIRTQSEVAGVGPVPLNVDVGPELQADGKIMLHISVQYDWPAPLDEANARNSRGTVVKTAIHDSMKLLLENGKAMIAAQSADPIGDRQVTVEVKATVLK